MRLVLSHPLVAEGGIMTTFDQVLKLAQQLPPSEQARLRAALADVEGKARAEQIARNQAAITMLDSWLAADEDDDGDEPWDEMLRTLDKHRESARVLYPDLHADSPEPLR
jgi:hypothetical protein